MPCLYGSSKNLFVPRSFFLSSFPFLLPPVSSAIFVAKQISISVMEQISTDVLVVGGGTGGTAAAIQASRRGVNTILVSEFTWLGGMLTAAGVCAPDGNELMAWQTGLWGAYLRELRQRQPGGLDNAWVSLFTYHPRIGADIWHNWVEQIPNLQWICGCKPLAVVKQGDRLTGVRFADFLVEAKIIIDGTELGDLLALGDLPYGWGWELQAKYNEPSAPVSHDRLTAKYPVQAPTWVFMLQDYSQTPESAIALSTDKAIASTFKGAWDNYTPESFLNYGKLQDNLYMINWPICGNDYGEGLNRLIKSETAAQEFLQEAYQHSYNFAGYIQSELGAHYGLASNIFEGNIHPAFALHPYYRESRRLQGKTTITENHILPRKDGCVAALPINGEGEVNAIAIGNYANDHHYPGVDFQLQPKSILWGGRWTGTPFTIPYDALFSESTPGFLVCEKNISVSHIANGSTRLQPVVMNIGQAAGMAAALCIEFNCQPQELPVRKIQEALLTDKDAPAAVIPLYDLSSDRSDWLYWQKYYLDNPQAYPLDGNLGVTNCQNYYDQSFSPSTISGKSKSQQYQGVFHCYDNGQYGITLTKPTVNKGQLWQLITLHPTVNRQLIDYQEGELITVIGRLNQAGNWLIIEKSDRVHKQNSNK